MKIIIRIQIKFNFSTYETIKYIPHQNRRVQAATRDTASWKLGVEPPRKKKVCMRTKIDDKRGSSNVDQEDWNLTASQSVGEYGSTWEEPKENLKRIKKNL